MQKMTDRDAGLAFKDCKIKHSLDKVGKHSFQCSYGLYKACPFQWYSLDQSMIFAGHEVLVTCKFDSTWGDSTLFKTRGEPCHGTLIEISEEKEGELGQTLCIAKEKNASDKNYGILERVFYNDIYIKVLDVHLEFAKNENLEELCSIEVVDTQDLKERPSTVTRQRRGRMIESEYLEPKNCLHKKQERMRRQAIDIGDCGRINYEKPSTDPFQDLTRILGGKASIPNNYPWMVLLLKQSPGGNFNLCGGSILNMNWVISAAHCVTQANWLVVYLGVHRLS